MSLDFLFQTGVQLVEEEDWIWRRAVCAGRSSWAWRRVLFLPFNWVLESINHLLKLKRMCFLTRFAKPYLIIQTSYCPSLPASAPGTP
jgi:hypothetical protein